MDNIIHLFSVHVHHYVEVPMRNNKKTMTAVIQDASQKTALETGYSKTEDTILWQHRIRGSP